MRMLDGFAGRFGWANAFLARGWEVTAIDIVRPQEIPEGVDFIRCNMLDVDAEFLKEFDFACFSSPCEQFSVWGMKHFHPNPPYPDLGIKLFNHTRAIAEASGVPYVMENVRAAQQFVGNAKHHCGPFYLWGNGVPPLLPQGIIKNCFSVWVDSKGKLRNQGPTGRAGRPEGERGVAACIERTAKAATIPPELSAAVANYAERIAVPVFEHFRELA